MKVTNQYSPSTMECSCVPMTNNTNQQLVKYYFLSDMVAMRHFDWLACRKVGRHLAYVYIVTVVVGN